MLGLLMHSLFAECHAQLPKDTVKKYSDTLLKTKDGDVQDEILKACAEKLDAESIKAAGEDGLRLLDTLGRVSICMEDAPWRGKGSLASRALVRAGFGTALADAALTDEVVRYRHHAVVALLTSAVHDGPDQCKAHVPTLKKVAENDKEPEVRSIAACAVAYLEPSKESVGGMCEYLLDKGVKRRQVWEVATVTISLAAKGKLDKKGAALITKRLVPHLTAPVKPKPEEVDIPQVQILRALAAVGSDASESVPSLIKLLDPAGVPPDHPIILEYGDTLLKIGTVEALAALFVFVENPATAPRFDDPARPTKLLNPYHQAFLKWYKEKASPVIEKRRPEIEKFLKELAGK